MFCTKCGATNLDDAKFCVTCGTPMQGPAATPAATAPPIPGSGRHAGPAETSGKAIASLICGLLFFVFPSAVAAIILGHLSLSEINRSAGRLAGRGMSIAGLVLGYAGVLFIPFLLIVAAIAIPNLTRARLAANQSSAVASLRTIASASLMYSERYGNGFPSSLIAMDGVDAEAPSCDHPQLIDSELATGRKNGYIFTYVALPEVEGEARPVPPQAAANGCTVGGASSFVVTADPVMRGNTGETSFYVDETGVIRKDETGTATKDSEPIE